MATALCALLLATAQAWATAPVLDTTFNGSPDHTLGTPGRLAVDEATGDVYVIDTANDVVDRFSSTGTFLGALRGSDTRDGTFNFGGDDDVAVDNSGGPNQGHVYVLSENATNSPNGGVFEYDANGNLVNQAHPTGFSDGCGVAVDASGQLWASDFTGGVIQLRTTDLQPVTGTPIVQTGNTCHIAFDNANNLFLNRWFSEVDKYDAPSYSTFAVIERLSTLDVATDSSNGDSYMDLGAQIDAYDSSGTAISGTPFDIGGQLAGVTVAGSFGKIFVSDKGNAQVQVFDRVGGAAPKPSARTGSADVTSSTTVTVHGATNPNGADTTCRVEYSTDPTLAGSSTQDCSAGAGSGTSEAPVSADLTGLTGHTTYYYRLVTTSANGTTNGSVSSFTTDVPPTVAMASPAANPVGQTTATVGGTVNPNSLDVTDCHFEYGTTTSYGSNAPCSALPGSGGSPVGVSAGLTGLSPSTTYHVRLVATNSAGTTQSSDATFTTQTPPPPAPVVTTGSATGVGQTGATIGGTVNAGGVSTTCAVQYGTTTAYGSTAPCSSALSGSSAAPISVALSGLAPGTTYHYRVTATNVSGTTNGADATFTTQPRPTNATLKLLGSATITVAGGKVPLKLSCVGDSGATCKGTVTLTVRAKVGKKLKTVTIGKASVNLTVPGNKTVTIKLSATGKKLLAKSRSHKLKATLSGPNRLKRTVVLKLKAVKKKKH